MAAPRDGLGSVETEGNGGRSESSGAEVVLSSDPATPAPLCPHGGSVSGLSLAVGLRGREGAVGFQSSRCLSASPPPCVMPRKRPFLGASCFSTY